MPDNANVDFSQYQFDLYSANSNSNNMTFYKEQ